jgi:arylsulfatase
LYLSFRGGGAPTLGPPHGSAVSQRYDAPFAFTGTLHEIEIQLLSQEDAEARDAELAEVAARAEMSRQ